jgi:hypothetical protein
MENTETTPENPTPEAPAEAAPEAPAPTDAQAEDPNTIGKLTPEEQAALMVIRQESQQLLAKIGEHEVLKMRLLARVDDLDQKGQEHINTISRRLGIEDGQQWVALQDGTIRLVKQNTPGQNGQGGAGAPPG